MGGGAERPPVVITLFPPFRKIKEEREGKAIARLLLFRGEILTDCSSALRRPLSLSPFRRVKSLGCRLSLNSDSEPGEKN